MSSITTLPPAPPALSKYIEDRYKVIEGSQSCHCCFSFTVVDMHNSQQVPGPFKPHALIWDYDPMCECFDLDSASKICEALNYLNRMTVD